MPASAGSPPGSKHPSDGPHDQALPPPPPQRRLAGDMHVMKETPAPNTGEVTIHSPAITGDVVATPPDPLLTPPDGHPQDAAGQVLYNATLAALPEGSRCIMVDRGAKHLTGAEAIRLGKQLVQVGTFAADQRTLLGYDE